MVHLILSLHSKLEDGKFLILSLHSKLEDQKYLILSPHSKLEDQKFPILSLHSKLKDGKFLFLSLHSKLHFGCVFIVGEGPLAAVFSGRNVVVLTANADLFHLVKRSLAEAAV